MFTAFLLSKIIKEDSHIIDNNRHNAQAIEKSRKYKTDREIDYPKKLGIQDKNTPPY